MLNKPYLRLKQQKSHTYNPTEGHPEPTQETFHTIRKRHCRFINDYPQEFKFLEDCSNCPLIEKISQAEGNHTRQPLFDLFEAGRQQGILRNYPINLSIPCFLHRSPMPSNRQ
jgi:hypothetical protein